LSISVPRAPTSGRYAGEDAGAPYSLLILQCPNDANEQSEFVFTLIHWERLLLLHISLNHTLLHVKYKSFGPSWGCGRWLQVGRKSWNPENWNSGCREVFWILRFGNGGVG